MNILLISPGSSVRHSGNRCTASQWADLLKRQGHDVVVCYDIPETLHADNAELLIAMHGEKCHRAIAQFRAAKPHGKILLALTGTDIYPHPSDSTLLSMASADGLIILQDRALEKIPPEFRAKSSLVIQSAQVRSRRPATRPASHPFDVCVIGHFRDVKNPLLTAGASRLLPAESAIRVLHAGGILDPKYGFLIAQEQRQNPRYRWLGELSLESVAELLASSALMVITSHSEGGARVVGESLVAGTPVLSTDIDGVRGLLGDSYPGFFPDGDAASLAALLWKCESDTDFYLHLQKSAAALAHRFDPDAEDLALQNAVASLFKSTSPIA